MRLILIGKTWELAFHSIVPAGFLNDLEIWEKNRGRGGGAYGGNPSSNSLRGAERRAEILTSGRYLGSGMRIG